MSDWKEIPLAEISRKMVIERHKKITTEVKNGKYKKQLIEKVQMIRVSKQPTLYTDFLGRVLKVAPDLPDNPCNALTWPPDVRRKATIKTGENSNDLPILV